MSEYPPAGAFGDEYPMLEEVSRRARKDGDSVKTTRAEFDQVFREIDWWADEHSIWGLAASTSYRQINLTVVDPSQSESDGND